MFLKRQVSQIMKIYLIHYHLSSREGSVLNSWDSCEALVLPFKYSSSSAKGWASSSISKIVCLFLKCSNSIETFFIDGLLFPFSLRHLVASSATDWTSSGSSPASFATCGSEIWKSWFSFVSEMNVEIRLFFSWFSAKEYGFLRLVAPQV